MAQLQLTIASCARRRMGRVTPSRYLLPCSSAGANHGISPAMSALHAQASPLYQISNFRCGIAMIYSPQSRTFLHRRGRRYWGVGDAKTSGNFAWRGQGRGRQNDGIAHDYFADRKISTRAFDTEWPKGTLKRFHPEITDVVDVTSVPDQMKIFDTIETSGTQVTLIDVNEGFSFVDLGNGSPHRLLGQYQDELQLWFRRIRVQLQALELSLLFERVLTELSAQQEW
jgi:hypothetical protein